jgi:cytochrome P450
LTDPGLQASLRKHLLRHPHLAPEAVSELLRVAGPSRAVFREARADVDIGAAHVAAGDRVILMLATANHDPERFAEPARVDCAREHSGHVAFGAGRHACAGASLVRMALDAATSALLRGTSVIELDATAPVEWIGGFAIRAPGALPVRVFRAPNPDGRPRD